MDKRQIAMNKWFLFWIIAGFCTILFGSAFINSDEKSLGIFGFVVGPFFIVTAMITEPVCYLFDSEGVSLAFTFFKKESYLWQNIRYITTGYEDRGHILSIPTPSCYTFDIDGKVEGDEKWYMKQYIRKTRRTKKLTEKYWGTVEDSDFVRFKNKVKKWQIKKQKNIDAHFTDEVVKAEREARAKVREITKPYADKARICNLDLKIRFYYVTADGDEKKSRPEEGYVYTACAEISYIGETDEDRVVLTDEDLLYVRMSKTGYKCIENKKSAINFTDALETVISVINEKGIEYYCD